MSILFAILGVVVLIVVGVVVAASFQPREFHVERSISTTATADTVFSIFSDLANWRDWSPFDGRDPDMKTELSDPSSSVGASYAWNGNKHVGEGQLTITRENPGQSIGMDLEFTRPFKCTNQVEWRVEDHGDSRTITWAMDGRNDPLMSRVFCMLMNVDKMCGKDFEAGLATLKSLSESKT